VNPSAPLMVWGVQALSIAHAKNKSPNKYLIKINNTKEQSTIVTITIIIIT
jgi:hypothetical protein